MLPFLLLLNISIARPTIILKNKTTIEFDIYREYNPYIAEEFTISRAGFTLQDQNGQYSINAYKSSIGIKYRDEDFIMIDPHWYIKHARNNDWRIEFGPAIRWDFIF